MVIGRFAALAIIGMSVSGCVASSASVVAAGAPTEIRASWYGGGEKLNAHTSTGERFDPLARTCAHRSLPFGTRIEVTYRGKSTVCRVNDRGPAAYTGRSLDLSRAAAADIGLIATGSGPVQISIINRE